MSPHRIPLLIVLWILGSLLAPARSAEDAFVRIAPDGKGFLRSGKPFHPFGCNYFGPHVGWAPKLWRQFDPEQVEGHFQKLESLGVNVVRVFLTAGSFFSDAEKLEPEAVSKLDRLIEIARRHGILVHPTGPDHWEGNPPWRQRDIFADPQALQAQVRFWRLLAARYRDETQIFAWDLLNEPHVGWGGASMETAWRAWLKGRYATREDLARAWAEEAEGIESIGTVSIPPDVPAARSRRLSDFQEFRERLGERWVKAQVDAIRASDARHLTTVGLIQWSVPILLDRPSRYATFRPARVAPHLDFLSVHFYPLHGDPLEDEEGLARNLSYLEFVLRYVKGQAQGKPLLVGEFGWYGGGKPDRHPPRDAEGQVRWCRSAVLQGRGIAAGWLNWAYADTPSSRDLTKFSGLVTEGGEVKPWGKAFAELARDPSSWLEAPREPEASLEFDATRAIVDAPSGGEALKRYLEAWRPGRGCRLVVTLPGDEAWDDRPAEPLPVAPGPFEPTMESLAGYACPDWFRDAKFGIWAHWGPQAVPMAGDWYARHMYVQGHRQYEDHLKRYGHPSVRGYKDIIPLWTAEKWDPDRLMALYKRAGARYFVSMGVHHDNFDLWNSKHQRWNAVNMGPKRDVVGEWQKAAKKYGLRFGVSEHLGASFTWFQDSHGADKIGPKAGVPYDGADPKLWDLYHAPANPGDKGWYSTDPTWQRTWFRRIQDLVDQYRPDLLYTDGGVPFGNEVGRRLIAHFYNSDAGGQSGKVDVVYTCKQRSEGRWVEDLERGVMAKINPYPWQTDTSIGDWYYNKDWKFRPVSWVVHMLADIVAKNGNLLLNVVQRPDGSLDPEVEEMLEEMASWMATNGEAIYGTRPWLVYGEGAARAKGGHFKEDFGYTYRDVRFTTKGPTLYAIALGWPEDARLVIRSLGKPAAGGSAIEAVSLLGHAGKVDWTQTTEGLVVTLPASKLSDIACVLKIAGKELEPVVVEEAAVVTQPDATGNLALLPEAAELHGDQIATEAQGGEPNVGFWDLADEWVSWKANVAKSGAYAVSASCATPHRDAEFALEVAGQKLVGKPPPTGGWADFRVIDLGRIDVKEAGEQTVKVAPAGARTWKAINLRWVKLTPVK